MVRGGFGVFYDQINMNPFLDFRPPIGGADVWKTIRRGRHPFRCITPTAARQTSYTWQPSTYVFPGSHDLFSWTTQRNCGANTYSVFSVNQNFRTPYFFNYNLNVEKSLGNGMAVWQIGYVGSEGRKLSMMLNMNQFPNTIFNSDAFGDLVSPRRLL